MGSNCATAVAVAAATSATLAVSVEVAVEVLTVVTSGPSQGIKISCKFHNMRRPSVADVNTMCAPAEVGPREHACSKQRLCAVPVAKRRRRRR